MLLRGGASPAGVDRAVRSGLCQLHPASAGGDERLHLLRLAADAALGQDWAGMAGPRYIADPPELIRRVALDGLTVLFHRPRA